MSNWREEIELTFPVVRYHPAVRQPSGALKLRTFAYLDSPFNTWGSIDGLAVHSHNGIGLSRSADFPSQSEYLPGGVIDFRGVHVPILGIDAPEHPPKGLASVILGAYSLYGTFRCKLSFGEPERVSLDEYKEKMTELNKQETHMPKTWRKIQQANSFYDAFCCDIPPPCVDHYSNLGPVRVKNWIDIR